MSTETPAAETAQAPFKFGDVVRHESGLIINVAACVRVVAHSDVRWAVYDAAGNRVWAKNCRLDAGDDQGTFVGISAVNGAAVHAEQTTAELKAEIESLAAQRDEARDELKEATAEFVRALSIAHKERDTLQIELERSNQCIASARHALDGKAAEVQS